MERIHPTMADALRGVAPSSDYDPACDEAERLQRMAEHDEARHAEALEEARELLANGDSARLVELLGPERLAEIVCDHVEHHVVEDEIAEMIAEPMPWTPCSAQAAVRDALAHLEDALATDWKRIQDMRALARSMAFVMGRAQVARSRLRALSATDYVLRRAS
jgi:hypothetical protein